MGYWRQYAHSTIYNVPTMSSFLSTIINLCIDVHTFDDCLCLLDCHLAYLRTLIVRIDNIQTCVLDPGGTVGIFFTPFCLTSVLLFKALPNLKCFSPTASHSTTTYDSHIVPLLRRMAHLKELILYLIVDERSTFIDGTRFENEILIHMQQF
ncbi:unnamed protein product [Rotaria socialis]|uniref:Uncharacterized protein n=1 Tax=Rotaria socialis TaxID=392032 RepID=A0A817QYV1_9BILA|nr:unnamed protein product [Rotaria socialis]